MRLVIVAGARPNFIKVAPIMWEIQRRPAVDALLVHTGQHYDERMSEVFFEQLAIPRPDVNLGVGSGSHAMQTADVMRRMEPVLVDYRPDAVVVVGDVNSTLACALTAAKLGVPVAHVEAGLRSFDRTMPEEINRIVTDAVSRWLFVSEPNGVENLRREGVPEDRTYLVGNVMIDSLLASRCRIDASPILEALDLPEGGYAVLTLHRPANVDQPAILAQLAGAVAELQRDIPIVFPVHPRTRAQLNGLALRAHRLRLTDPLGYLDFMKLLSRAKLVLTDSGGVQEETTVLGVPCLTLRDNTERPITVTHGTNLLVGRDPARILAAARRILAHPAPPPRAPELWDGRTAGRIMEVLAPSS